VCALRSRRARGTWNGSFRTGRQDRGERVRGGNRGGLGPSEARGLEGKEGCIFMDCLLACSLLLVSAQKDSCPSKNRRLSGLLQLVDSCCGPL